MITSQRIVLFNPDLNIGHYTFECKNPRPYVSRPSRTQQLENPKLREKLKNTGEVPDEFKRNPRVSFLLGFLVNVHASSYRTGLASRILEEREKARLKLGTEDENVGNVMETIKKRKKEQKERSSSSKKRRYVNCPLLRRCLTLNPYIN